MKRVLKFPVEIGGGNTPLAISDDCIISGANSTSPNGCTIEEYVWEINGQQYSQTGSGAENFDTSNLNLSSGTYTLCLTVRDCYGWSEKVCCDVLVCDPPIAKSILGQTDPEDIRLVFTSSEDSQGNVIGGNADVTHTVTFFLCSSPQNKVTVSGLATANVTAADIASIQSVVGIQFGSNSVYGVFIDGVKNATIDPNFADEVCFEHVVCDSNGCCSENEDHNTIQKFRAILSDNSTKCAYSTAGDGEAPYPPTTITPPLQLATYDIGGPSLVNNVFANGNSADSCGLNNVLRRIGSNPYRCFMFNIANQYKVVSFDTNITANQAVSGSPFNPTGTSSQGVIDTGLNNALGTDITIAADTNIVNALNANGYLDDNPLGNGNTGYRGGFYHQWQPFSDPIIQKVVLELVTSNGVTPACTPAPNVEMTFTALPFLVR